MKAKQLTLFDRGLPAHVCVIDTADLDLLTEAGSEQCVRRMLAVPMGKSILLDFLIGYERGGTHPSEEHIELHRLQLLLNSQFRHQRFNFLGSGLAATLFRKSIRSGLWKPRLLEAD